MYYVDWTGQIWQSEQAYLNEITRRVLEQYYRSRMNQTHPLPRKARASTDIRRSDGKEEEMSARQRLEHAFDELRELGYEAHPNFWCCQNCALAALPEEADKWCYWHQQDDDDAFAGTDELERRTLHLRWAGDGHEIMEVLSRYGFQLVNNMDYNEDRTLEISER